MGYLVARVLYTGDQKDVIYVWDEEWAYQQNSWLTLYPHMKDFVVNGNTTEILAYYPNRVEYDKIKYMLRQTYPLDEILA